jgi:hypothetical protein
VTTFYEDKAGVWMLYDQDVAPYIIQIGIDVVPLAHQAARQAYGRVGFWPFDMNFQEAVAWWEAPDKQEE